MAELPTEPWDPEEQLVHAVLEEQQLWELSQGTNCGMHRSPVFHPAPDPAWASQRLLQWLDASLIELVEDQTPGDAEKIPEQERLRAWPAWHPAVSDKRARAALRAPSRWSLACPEGVLGMRPTDHGLAAGSEEWGVAWMGAGHSRTSREGFTHRLAANLRRWTGR